MSVFTKKSEDGLFLKTDGSRASAKEEAETVSKAVFQGRVCRARAKSQPSGSLPRRCERGIREPQSHLDGGETKRARVIRAKLNNGFVVLLDDLPTMGTMIRDRDGREFKVTGVLVPASSAECDVILSLRQES